MDRKVIEYISKILVVHCNADTSEVEHMTNDLLNKASELHSDKLFSEAELLYKVALDMMLKAGNWTQEYQGRALFGLADLYSDQALYENAAPLYLSAIRIWEELYGSVHQLVGLTLRAYAESLWKLNRTAEAKLVADRAHSILGTKVKSDKADYSHRYVSERD